MLTVITGPMFSGKTSRLLDLGRAHTIANLRVGYFKPKRDSRYSDSDIVTHNNEKISCTIVDNPVEILNRIDDYDVFCIDEAQFFNKHELETTVTNLLYVNESIIIVSGLSQDFDGKPFGAMPYLLAIADDIIHLKAVCAKTKRIGVATRTFRKDTSNDNQILIGGKEMYEPRSFKEWIRQ